MKEIMSHLSAVEVVDTIISHAVYVKASDIHCDPQSSCVLVRMRVHGIMEHITMIPKKLHEEIIARLKILAGARTDLHIIPQDGRWKVEGDIPYNIRISFMPTYHGENAVMRLLPIHTVHDVSFAKLGFTPDHERSIYRAIAKTSGLILVTGPTGSGKTTTLHTCLVEKARESLSIITLEDPIEYELPGIRQVYVRHTQGMTFAHGLRSSLRQDPDVIMVGEIRDSETARVAIHTALTGHLVLSTLHTNSSLEAIPRLIDMGIDPYLLASTLRLVIGQRLVRTVCSGCNLDGCEMCRQSGYAGRAVIAEVCEIDSRLKEMILKKASSANYQSYARSKGFISMAEDGIEKVEWGVTTHTEVQRVLYE